MSRLFPELDETQEAPRHAPRIPLAASIAAAAPGVTHEANPPPAATAERQVWLAGPRALAALERAFGLEALSPDKACRLLAVTVPGDGTLRAEIAGGAVPPTTFWLGSPEAEKVYLKTRNFSIWYSASDEPTAGEETIAPSRSLDATASPAATVPRVPVVPLDRAVVIKTIAQRLRLVSLPVLFRVVHADRVLRNSPPPVTGDAKPKSHSVVDFEIADSLVYSFRSERSWRSFVEGHEQYRGYCKGFKGKVTTVHHADIECHFSEPRLDDGSVSFFNRVVTEPSHSDSGDGADSECFVTDMSDREIISGGGRKLDAVLDQIARSSRQPDLILVQSACISIVTGDDIDASVDRVKKKVSIPVLNLGNPVAPEHEVIRQARKAPDFLLQEKRPGSINVVGMARMAGHHDLFAALSECGIEVNCWLLPEVDLNTFSRYMAAELQVLYDWEFNASAYRDLLEGIALPSITPPAPFGVARTREFLSAIAGALGRGAAFTAMWERRLGAALPTWNTLSAAARAYRLGFVVDDATLKRLVNPHHLMGIPFLPMIEEMGFGIDLLLYRPDGAAAIAPAVSGDHVRVFPFETPDELEVLLRSSEAVAFYSEMYFDRRLSRTGKSSFSLSQVDMGLSGAIEMLRRLLGVCRLPFYRKYSRYFGKPFQSGAGANPPVGNVVAQEGNSDGR